MGHPRYTKEEIARRGREIYDRALRQQLEPANVGKFVVIDIETGEYELDDDLTASMREYHKKPEGARYGMRIGYDAAGTLGNALAPATR